MEDESNSGGSSSNTSLARRPWRSSKEEARAKYAAPYCPYECKICHKRFPTKQALGGHSNGHNQEKRFMSEYYRRHFEAAPPLPPGAAVAFFELPPVAAGSSPPGSSQFVCHPLRPSAAADQAPPVPQLKILFPLSPSPAAVRSAHKLTPEFIASLGGLSREELMGAVAAGDGGGGEEEEEEDDTLDLTLHLW